MDTRTPESGFTLVELMIASLVTLVIMGVAFSTFRDALVLNDAVVQVAESSQNLRTGTNLLVRDLLQAGRRIETGGIPIPSGSNAAALKRPSPVGKADTFKNAIAGDRLTAIVTGAGLGPTVAGQPTDIVTIVLEDPFRNHSTCT